MIFRNIIQPEIKIDEIVVIQLLNGKSISGIVNKIDKKYVWIKPSKDAEAIRFNLRLDQILKVN